jgi:hypothetical protein
VATNERFVRWRVCILCAQSRESPDEASRNANAKQEIELVSSRSGTISTSTIPSVVSYEVVCLLALLFFSHVRQ